MFQLSNLNAKGSAGATVHCGPGGIVGRRRTDRRVRLAVVTTIERLGAPVPHPGFVRFLVGAQMVCWGGYLLVLAKLAIAGLIYGGFGFQPFGSDPTMFDPKEVFGLGIPEYIVHLPLFYIVLAGAVPSIILLVAAAFPLVALWRANAPRRRLLSISTAMTLVCLIVQLTPFQSVLLNWMLD